MTASNYLSLEAGLKEACGLLSKISLLFVTVYIFYRPGVAGAVYKHLGHLFIMQCFSSKSSKHHKSQTVRARELKFWKNVHPLKHFTCQMSSVTCHMSCIMCHM